MAATDQNYRNQQALDIVFAVSSILMLLSIVWMFVQDYNREFKEEQRRFRDVESAIAQRQAIDQIPSEEEIARAEKVVDEAKQERAKHDEKYREYVAESRRLAPEREKIDAKYQGVKADLESINSFYANEIEISPDHLTEKAKAYLKQIHDLEAQLAAVQAERDTILAKQKDFRQKADKIEQPLTESVSKLKKMNDRFDTQVKLASTKQWGFADWVRALPIIDGFASPIKIHQITNNDIPIDYNFKYVTRFDRCTTCHLGIDRPTYGKDNLRGLTNVTADQEARLQKARTRLESRQKTLAGLPEERSVPDPHTLTVSKVRESDLTEARINEYSSHPRLDLFVTGNSKHPVEKFGCSTCHYGQGSATSFTLAAHTPNGVKQKERWIEEHDWESQHMWDFPMLPTRFIESSCVKCHYQVTDLVSSGNRQEAPQLLRGYNLIKENGCFGCHEISGMKGGREIGPDIRLEPTPPLESLTPLERSKIEGDAENPPGRMRKVGPSLYRLNEKSNPDWTAKWVRVPREFRPDTKMPHFYGLSNNDPHALPDGQKKFPDTEIWAVTQFLFDASKEYTELIKSDPAARAKDQERFDVLKTRKEELKDAFPKLEQREMDRLAIRIKLRAKANRDTPLVDLAKGYEGNPENGRVLFTERGCLACHVHEATDQASGKPGTGTFSPAVTGEAVFGPNLSQLTGKLGKQAGDKASARTWLVQWIMDPHVHSPRSRMPVTHLESKQAADVAAWLLAQAPKDLGADWDNIAPKQPGRAELVDLAKVYLVRVMPEDDMRKLLETGKIAPEIVNDLGVEEQDLADNFSEEALKHYLGRKAVSRLGCYACHDIPGFDTAKPIGVALNDWGKKDPSRLEYANIENFLENHFKPVKSLVDEQGNPQPIVMAKGEDGKSREFPPYEKFYWNKVTEHGRDRIGFLNQKLVEPRSYDYKMRRTWDDRYRMPQFRFARARMKPGEDPKAFEARAWMDEAIAREAVATFILGLVAEPVPTKFVNQPKGDRLAEVQGLQILQKYNCAGCHLVRPGSFDFRVTPDALKELDERHLKAQVELKEGGFSFPDDNHWTGTNSPAADRIPAHGPWARYRETEDGKSVVIRLTEAVRFLSGGQIRDIPSSNYLYLPLDAVVSNPDTIKSQADLDRHFHDRQASGGTLSDLLRPYLQKKNPDLYKFEGDAITGDSSNARAALPPALLSQGQRTQPDWLFQFLLDPQAVRKMTILRMPKFNMSHEEARALVDYFAAVERITNPGVGLGYPLATVPQQGPLDHAYWAAKNKEYVAQLSAAGKDDDGSLERRLNAYRQTWDKLRDEQSVALKKDLERAREDEEARTKKREAKKSQLDDEKDAVKKKELQADIEALDKAGEAAKEQVDGLTARLDKLDAKSQEKTWLEQEAYATDGWKLVANRKLCLTCHQVGDMLPSNKETSGPPLTLASQRLRPEWALRWIASPKHFGAYVTPPMPPYFNTAKNADPKTAEYQHLFAGSALQQVEAARDVIMNYPFVSTLPANRLWRPDQADEKK